MKAVRVTQFGGPDSLRLEDVPVPEPGPAEVRVRVESIGLNFVEIYQRTGAYKGALPFIPGNEAAGIVDAVGSEVTELKVGERVVSAWFAGAYAAYTIAPASRVVSVPAWLDLKIAAAVILQGATAHYLAHSTYPLKAGDTALVHAAAGGTGALLVQIAKRRGARIIGTTSTDEKAQLAREAGADDVILYTQQDFEAEVKRLTHGKGVDVVYDSVGKTTFDKSLNCLRPRGYLVLFGQSSGAVPPVDPQILNAKGSLFLTRPTLANYTANRDELTQRVWDLFRWIGNRELAVRIDKTFPLEDAAQAHRYMEARETRGKVLLTP
jgi:NADPH:quinone reductase